MVKVLPSNFTLYESQHILSPSGEPLAITCSNDLLFIAVEECTIEAYDLRTLEQLAQVRTVSPVSQVAYNCIADCIVTLEKKQATSQGFVRVYFKWRGLSVDKPMRILMASGQRSIPGQNRIAAEIVELPSDSGNSVSCLTCCEYTGRIAVGMGSLLRVFTLERIDLEQPQGTSAGDHWNAASSHPSPPSPTPPSSHPSPPSPTPPSSLHSPPSPTPLTSLPSPPSPTPTIEILLDIQTNTPQLEMISIVGDYVAFISTNEARVVKLSLFQTGTSPILEYHPRGIGTAEDQKEGVAMKEGKIDGPQPQTEIVEDQNFISWSPSAVWEAEKKARNYKSKAGYTSHVTSSLPQNHMMADDVTNNDHMTSPLIGTVNLESITKATSEKLSDRATMEVLGPVEYVWGQPLNVRVNQPTECTRLATPDCRVLTMLYRRFSTQGGSSGAHQLMGLSRNRRASLPVRVQNVGIGKGLEGEWDGLHTVKLIPTFAENTGSASDPPRLVGISCFLANRFHSYLYDVHQRCRLLSAFSFMEKSRLASCDGTLLHALSSDSVETYTSRAFQAAISNLPRGSAIIPTVEEGSKFEGSIDKRRSGGERKVTEEREEGEEKGGGRREGDTGKRVREGGEGGGRREGGTGKRVGEEGERWREEGSHSSVPQESEFDQKGCVIRNSKSTKGADTNTWLSQLILSPCLQPIPPHNLDLTLVSTSKFIGCCYLATSQNYIVVVTKAEAEPQATTGTNWLLQSLTLRKTRSEQMWNIYILKLKPASDLCHQFMELAESMKETSPPLRQHLLSEGHVLLRQQAILGGCTEQLLRRLQENCFQLADSLCRYSKWNGTEMHASYYFIMSGRPIADVVHHILSTYTPEREYPAAYSILVTYLNLVLFDRRNAEKQMPCLLPIADTVLEIYANHAPASHMTSHVISLLLDSWLCGYSSEKALSLLETQLKSTNEGEGYPGKMCYAMLCVRCGRDKDARHSISLVPKEFVQQWMRDNLWCVVDSAALSFTPLGKLVLSVHEMCVLELLVAMLSTGKMTFHDLCTLLQNGDRQDLAQKTALKHFLEATIFNRSKVISMDTTTKAVLLLVNVLFACLSSKEDMSKSSTSTPYSVYGSRHRWLDNMVPFGGGEGEEGGRCLSVGVGEEKRRRRYHLHILMQLQALLCSSHMSETVATRVEELLTQTHTQRERGGGGEGENDGLSTYKFSLQLLSWPHLGRMREACQLVLDLCPLVTVDYCHTMFPNDLDLWAWLLEQLLGYTQSEGEPGPLYGLYVSVYKEALGHVITLTTPQQFLSLLPPTGSVEFFLPFIERSCKQHSSHTVSERLHTSLSEPS